MRYDIELADLQEQHAAVVRGHVARGGIAEFLGGTFGEVMAVVGRQRLTVAGPPFGRYLPTDDGGFEVEAGFPVRGTVSPDGRVVAASLPGGPVAFTVHHGDYGSVADAYGAVGNWLTDNGFVPDGEPWERYLDGPEVASPRTEVFFPCRKVRPRHPVS